MSEERYDRVIEEIKARDSDYTRLRRLIEQIESGTLADGETANKPCPLRGELVGEDDLLLFVIKNRTRTTASGLVTGLDNWAQDNPNAGIICQVSPNYSRDPITNAPKYASIHAYREKAKSKNFLGPAVFFKPGAAHSWDAPEGLDSERWAIVNARYLSFMFDATKFDECKLASEE